MTSVDDNTQVVIKAIRCPRCRQVITYRISVKGTQVAAMSLWNRLMMFYIMLVPFATLIFLKEGLKVLILTGIGAILITLADWILSRVIWWLIEVVRITIVKLRRLSSSSRARGETTVRPFTLVLKCPKCPNTSESFQVKLWLPIERGGDNDFAVTNIEAEG